MMSMFGCSTDRAKELHTSAFDSLPTFRTVEPFSGVDHRGKPLLSSALRGHVWLGSFFFTRCETVCPALNTVQTGLQRSFGASVKFVSISSDPEFDTPSVMAEYATRYGARDGVWWFVNLPQDEMMRLASSSLGLIPPASPDMHSTRFVLVDTAMHVRGYYDSADTADMTKLRAALAGVAS